MCNVYMRLVGLIKKIIYSTINFTKSPASGAGNVSETRLMSKVGRVRDISVFLQSELYRYQYWSADVAAAVT